MNSLHLETCTFYLDSIDVIFRCLSTFTYQKLVTEDQICFSGMLIVSYAEGYLNKNHILCLKGIAD